MTKKNPIGLHGARSMEQRNLEYRISRPAGWQGLTNSGLRSKKNQKSLIGVTFGELAILVPISRDSRCPVRKSRDPAFARAMAGKTSAHIQSDNLIIL